MKAIPKRQYRRLYVAAGLLVGAAVGVADYVQDDNLVLTPLFVFAPLVACIRATAQQTFRVATLAVVATIAFGFVDDIWGTQRHTVAIATTVLGGLLAVWLAAARDARDQELAASLPILRAADRLKISLATSRIGEWSWDRKTDAVTWDDNVVALFGLIDGEFNGTFDMWIRLIDERDREFVRKAIADAVDTRSAFRFDHRCTWPDGSAHWIESIGDVVLDPKNDQVVGAFGLAVDIDERKGQIEERTRLLEFERRQRERIEYLASINEVLVRSVDLDEIVRTVTTAIILEFAVWGAIVVSIDRPRPRPSITVAHRDPEKVRWLRELLVQYPYNPDGRWGLSAVIRTGKPELVPKVDFARLPGVDPEVLANVDPASVITVPLIGALGTLGALQVIRSSNYAPFNSEDMALVEEIADRVAAAINNAILFQRQSRARAAFDTLQSVSGLIASAATSDEIVRAALAHGAHGIRATSGSLFLTDKEGGGELVLKEEVGAADLTRRLAELDAAQQAIKQGGGTVMGMVQTDAGELFVAAAPMQIMNRVVGALAFTLDDEVEPTTEELLMLATLGSRCAGALERAALYERERNIALTLQHRLLSTLPETPDWLDACAAYVPATGIEIGGDWFQLLDVGDTGVAAVVGDAVGHGVGSAAAMGQLQASFMTAVATNPEPLTVLAAVDLFASRGADTMAASAAYILLDPAGSAHYASAGHPPIVHVPARGSATVIDGARGSVLGCRTEPGESTTFSFEPGDLIVMYTDGLIELRDEAIDDGIERLVRAAEAARDLKLQEACDAIVQALTAERLPEDDIAILTLRRN